MTCTDVRHCPGHAWPWELLEPLTCETGITGFVVKHELFRLSPRGVLVVESGYAWDGASGPAVDTGDWIRASCIHDCLYQMIRERLLTPHHRAAADYLMRQTLLQDGMHPIRAWLFWMAVRLFGKRAVR